MNVLLLVAIATAVGFVAVLLAGRAPLPTRAGPAGAAPKGGDELGWALAQGTPGFERLLVRLFAELGFTAEPPSRSDEAVEFFAVDPAPIRGGRIYVLGLPAAHGAPVGPDEVRAAIDTARGDLATKAVIVTIGAFSPEAREAARHQPVDLLDGGALAALLRRHLPQEFATRTA